MSATDSVRKLRRACGIWLLLVCMLTFPWGLVYAAPVLLAYAMILFRRGFFLPGAGAGC